LHGENNERSYSDADVDVDVDASRDSADSILLDDENNNDEDDEDALELDINVVCVWCNEDVQAVAVLPFNAIDDDNARMLLCIKSFIFGLTRLGSADLLMECFSK